MKKKELESFKINIYYHLEESKSCKHWTFIISVSIDLQKHIQRLWNPRSLDPRSAFEIIKYPQQFNKWAHLILDLRSAFTKITTLSKAAWPNEYIGTKNYWTSHVIFELEVEET